MKNDNLLTLKGWIEREGVEKISKALQVQPSAVNHWKRGYVLPRAATMLKIEKLTNGSLSVERMTKVHHSNANSKNRWRC